MSLSFRLGFFPLLRHFLSELCRIQLELFEMSRREGEKDEVSYLVTGLILFIGGI